MGKPQIILKPGPVIRLKRRYAAVPPVPVEPHSEPPRPLPVHPSRFVVRSARQVGPDSFALFHSAPARVEARVKAPGFAGSLETRRQHEWVWAPLVEPRVVGKEEMARLIREGGVKKQGPPAYSPVHPSIVAKIEGRRTDVTPQKPTTPVGRLREPPSTRMRRRYAADRTSTPEFKSWFGGSKVVDEHGSPKPVYHGTIKNFDEFNTDLPEGQDWGMVNNGIGAHFAEEPSVASAFSTGHYVRPTDYAVSEYDPSQSWYRHKGELIYGKGVPTLLKEDQHGRESLEPYDHDKHGSSYFLREKHGPTARIVMMPPGGQTHKVYLSVKNPLLVVPDDRESDQAAVARAIANKVFPHDRQLFIDALNSTGRKNGGEVWDAIASGRGYDGGEYERYKTFDDVSRNFSGLLNGRDRISRAKTVLKLLGYDGVKYKNTSRNEVHEGDNPWAWIAFHPHQIKSAIANRGTFDSRENNTKLSRRLV